MHGHDCHGGNGECLELRKRKCASGRNVLKMKECMQDWLCCEIVGRPAIHTYTCEQRKSAVVAGAFEVVVVRVDFFRSLSFWAKACVVLY